jgi:hypothetical protein
LINFLDLVRAIRGIKILTDPEGEVETEVLRAEGRLLIQLSNLPCLADIGVDKGDEHVEFVNGEGAQY